ncbi:MAG: hypothetical protein ACM37U_10990 [Gemmatimonas sp.]|nr:hypothetical protein [Gemmatimonadaceae bacterium]
MSVDVGENEAPLVEAKTRQRRHGASMLGAQIAAGTKDGIALGFIHAAAGGLEPMTCRRTKEIGDTGLLARTKVEHATTRRLPRVAAGQIDIDAILVRDVRSEDVEDIDLSRRRGGGVGVALFVRRERILVGMRAGVRARDARNRRIGEDDGTVARS